MGQGAAQLSDATASGMQDVPVCEREVATPVKHDSSKEDVRITEDMEDAKYQKGDFGVKGTPMFGRQGYATASGTQEAPVSGQQRAPPVKHSAPAQNFEIEEDTKDEQERAVYISAGTPTATGMSYATAAGVNSRPAGGFNTITSESWKSGGKDTVFSPAEYPEMRLTDQRLVKILTHCVQHLHMERFLLNAEQNKMMGAYRNCFRPLNEAYNQSKQKLQTSAAVIDEMLCSGEMTLTTTCTI